MTVTIIYVSALKLYIIIHTFHLILRAGWVTFDKGVVCPDPVDTVHLTDEHKAIIRRTWAPLKENLVDCGTRVFIRIFQVGPTGYFDRADAWGCACVYACVRECAVYDIS